nr:N-acetylmuramoyl-L-alanine amidase [Enterococcus gallinarum]
MSIKSVHAGHGGRKNGSSWTDPGAVGCGYKEADVARTITAMMVKKAGLKNVTDNAGTTANAIVNNVANNINKCADGWHISNHLNAFNGSATGVEVLYGSSASKATAAKLSATIAKALGLVDRGAKDGTWLGIARNSGAGKKVLLIEWGFIDNKKDMQALMAKMEKAVDAALAVFGYATNSSNNNAAANKPSTSTTSFKVGDKVKIVDALYKDCTGAGRSTASRGKTGTIKRVVSGNKPYLIDSLGWAHKNDIQLVTTSNATHKVGDTVTVQSFATNYQTGQKIPNWVKGQKYKIKKVKSVNQSRSKKAYLLDDVNSWFLEQDIK